MLINQLDIMAFPGLNLAANLVLKMVSLVLKPLTRLALGCFNFLIIAPVRMRHALNAHYHCLVPVYLVLFSDLKSSICT